MATVASGVRGAGDVEVVAGVSPDGTATKMALATLFGTWHAQDIDLYLACR